MCDLHVGKRNAFYEGDGSGGAAGVVAGAPGKLEQCPLSSGAVVARPWQPSTPDRDRCGSVGDADQATGRG
jgi:hypothetical protein